MTSAYLWASFVHHTGIFHIRDLTSVVCQATRESVSDSVRSPTLSSRCEKGQRRTKVVEKWRTILSAVLLWAGPPAHEVYKKVSWLGKRAVVLLGALSEWKIKLQHVSLGKWRYWSCCCEFKLLEVIKDCISYLLYVCAYSPVWKLKHWWESWGGTLTPTAEPTGLWRPVGWSLGVCHSLVHWTLPLHRVFSWFLFLSSMTIFGFSASIMTISCANISRLL